MNRNLIIKNPKEIVTPIGLSGRFGREMNDLKVLHNSSILVEDGIIKAVGPSEEILNGLDLSKYEVIDAGGSSVLPGFVDSHTHFIFGGYRENEFNLRLQGASYMEIMEAGGGISSTVNATGQASVEDLYKAGYKRLNSMMEFGVTTLEGKSGYGLLTETELKQLEVMKNLNDNHDLDIAFTFMGAHDVPVEYKGSTDEFIDYLIEDSLPKVKDQGIAEFCDIFTEKNIFDIDQSRKLLTAAKNMGFKLKMHADEIVPFGGAELAGELSVISADHLLQASDEGIFSMRDSGSICTLLPCTAFSLKESYARGRFMIDHGAAVALATDFNPGSCFTNSIPLLIALSTIYMNLTIEEVITGLTLNGAAAIDRAASIGSLEVGKLADIIILDAPSYKFLSYNFGVNQVKTVIKKGKVIYNKEV